MDDVSVRTPMQWPSVWGRLCLSRYILYTQHIHSIWSDIHYINIWLHLLFTGSIMRVLLIQTVLHNTRWTLRNVWHKLSFVSVITFCLSCKKKVWAYSTRLSKEDLQLGYNQCLIHAVTWDEVKADSGRVMNLYEMTCPALLQTQVACNILWNSTLHILLYLLFRNFLTTAMFSVPYLH